MRWFVCLSVLVVCGPVQAQSADELPTEVRNFLGQYVNAWQSGNPFHLVDLSSKTSHVFDELLDHGRFDRIQQTLVRLQDVRVVETSDDGKRTVVSFVKDHEDLYWDGTLSRGLAHVRMALRVQDDVVRTDGTNDWGVTSHRVVWSDDDENSSGEAGGHYTKAERELYAALAYLRDSRYQAALERLDTAVAQQGAVKLQLGGDRFQAQLQYYRSVCLNQGDRAQDALAALQKATALNPEFPLALNALARHASKEGRLGDAMKDFQRSLDLYPGQSDVVEEVAYLRRALTYMRTDVDRENYLSLRGLSPQRALEIAKQQHEANPDNMEWRRMVAVLYMENHQPARAESLLLKANESASDPHLLYVLARSAMAQNKSDVALERFQKVWRRAPSYRDTIVYLVELSAQSNQWRTAIAYLNEALKRRPGAADLLYKLGVYELRLGRRYQAMTSLKQAREQRPPRPIRRALYALLQQL